MKQEHKELIKQSIFGVLFQGKKSMYGPACMYRSDDGCRCAVGWIIPDENYCETMEGTAVKPVYYDNLKGDFDFDDILEILTAIQQSHDNRTRDSTDENVVRESFKEALRIKFYHSKDEELIKEILAEWEVESKFMFAIRDAIIATYKQGAASKSDTGLCAYRGEGGLRCVVGHMIKDEFYSEDIEGSPLLDSRSRCAGPMLETIYGDSLPEVNSDIIDKWINVSEELQECHDVNGSMGEKFAESFKAMIQARIKNGKIPVYFEHTLAQLK